MREHTYTAVAAAALRGHLTCGKNVRRAGIFTSRALRAHSIIARSLYVGVQLVLFRARGQADYYRLGFQRERGFFRGGGGLFRMVLSANRARDTALLRFMTVVTPCAWYDFSLKVIFFLMD